MIKNFTKLFLLCGIALISTYRSFSQLVIKPESDPKALIEKLLGQGVTISNWHFTGNDAMAGFFNNLGNTKIGIDSGIVLTNGRAKTSGVSRGVDGDGFTLASTVTADNAWGLSGDGDLATEIGSTTGDLHDACVLEFDFIPLGDSIKFNYVFSSEEYTPAYVCSFNDAFAFFIKPLSIPGPQQNIALIPSTTTPVSIFNVNDVPGGGCPNNQPYYRDNESNKFFTHDGHTAVLTALAKVVPCEKYHLKLVIADVGDDMFDSGVFLEAKSLSSNAISMSNLTQIDPTGNSYLVEGCATGSFKIVRPKAEPAPLTINLSYGGTMTNGVDVQPLPLSVTIPAHQTEVTIDVLPIIDGIPEGIETIKVYAIAGCASGLPTDSVTIQLRDYDILGINPDTAKICKDASITLTASPGYSIYEWDANPTLSSVTVNNPVATPVSSATTYYCTATEGTCHARDSSFIKWKDLELLSKTEINCKDAANGTITVDGGDEWIAPVEYSINNGPYQASNTFTGLAVGSYKIKIKDASGCTDSLTIDINQLFPDLLIGGIPVTAATCSGGPDGTATVNAAGGKSPYTYSADGTTFQASNILNLRTGNYTITIKDQNGCTTTKDIFIPFINSVVVDAGTDVTICEGKSAQLHATTNGTTLTWWPPTGLNNTGIPDPVANPVDTIKYYTTAVTGICTRVDSVMVFVIAAPVPEAGPNTSICFGQDTRLAGSGGADYSWKPSSYLSDTRVANPLAQRLPGTITYYLKTIDAHGCASLVQDSVTITVTRPALLDVGRDTVVAINQPLPLFAADVNHIGFTEYTWVPSYGLDRDNIADPLAILGKDVTYRVTARTAIGCEATDIINIRVYKGPDIYVPNAFSPNNDNRNDILRAIPVGIKEFRYFRVFNRWGQPIFHTANPTVGWDGKISSKEQETSTFVWIAEGVDYKGNIIQRKGTVTIVR